MAVEEAPAHSGGVPSTPHLRLLVVRDFATQVYGKELTAAAWLGQTSEAILGGACIVATACQTEEGFQQAMDELKRVRALRRDDLGRTSTISPAGGPPPVLERSR